VGWLEARKIPILFAVATLLPIAALCWLALRTLDQDRELERQRRRERLEVTAARVAVDIERELQWIDTRLSEGIGIRFLPAGLTATDSDPILFQPDPAPDVTLLPRELEEVARQEVRNPAAAIAAYQRFAHSSSAAVRAEALLALGGLYRGQRRVDEATRVYTALEQLGDVQVAGGQPAGLVARQGRLKTFLEAGDRARVRDEAIGLGHALRKGEWSIDRATFDLYETEMVARWGGPVPTDDNIRRTMAAIELWHTWRRNELPPRGRRFVGGKDPSVLAVWVTTATGAVAALFTPEKLQQRLRSTWQARGLTVAGAHGDGRTIFGGRVDGAVVLSPVQTQLPFQIAVGGGGIQENDYTLRTALLIGGVVLACALMIAASYGLYRITTRELQLARQQSDFVAAVSHEFRTPLTSMRHLLDLLLSRGISDEARKQSYYGLLAGETERLQRMVETLLSFGRIDAGAHVWKLEPLNLADVVETVVDDIERDIGTRPLIVNVESDLPLVQADREALGRAVWNLLENAAKYSPGNSPIRVFARRHGSTVLVGVQDQGIGIPVSEHQRIFQKFVRGEQAKRAGIRGVGVGLALVKRIVEAHGGRVQVVSEIGTGSTFTLVLPAINSQVPNPESQSAVAHG
jgi:signal transduction histidine kinase